MLVFVSKLNFSQRMISCNPTTQMTGFDVGLPRTVDVSCESVTHLNVITVAEIVAIKL